MREKTSQLTGLMELMGRLPGAAATASDGISSGNSVLPRAAAFSRSDGDIVVSGDAVLPVLPALADLLPAGGLARGSVVAVDRSGLLCLALVAGASAAGAWCGVAGVPDLGVVAAAALGAAPARLMLVPDPGPGWPQVVASMLEACEVVVVRPPARLQAEGRRRLEGVLRRGGGVLVVAGEWEGAPVRLRVTRRSWAGIGDGYGSLRACRAEVVAEGRGAVTRPRRRWLWLPAPDGTVAPDETAAADLSFRDSAVTGEAARAAAAPGRAAR
jgi:hypothetical protein